MIMTEPGQSVPQTMRASVLRPGGVIEMVTLATPVPRHDEVLVRVAAVGICGSDVHYFRDGRIGPFVVDAPLILGHEVSGTIVQVGSEIDRARIGRRVAIEPQRPCRMCAQCKAGRYNLCPRMDFYATPPIDGALCDYVTIQSDFAHQVPDNVTDEAAALLEPLSVGIAAIRRGGVSPGSRVLIAGGGPIGVIVAQAARAFGAVEVVVSDPQPMRRELAARFGATSTVDPTSTTTADLEVDVFIDACGIPSAIIDGVLAVRGAGTVVLVGTGSDEVAFPIPVIQNRELQLTGIFRYTDTWPIAAHLVSSGQIDLDSLVTHRFPLERVVEALNVDLDPTSLKAIVSVA